MDVGKLNRQITIECRTEVLTDYGFEDADYKVDENGFHINEFTDVTFCWASVTNIHGKELLNNINQLTANTYKRIKIRYKRFLDETLYFDVTNNFRIKYHDSYWNITSIDDIQDRHEYMEILITKIETM